MKVDTSKMTFVYVAGGRSAIDNYTELKLSIRSLINVPHKDIVVIGKNIDWLKKEYLIEASDCFENKHSNVINKLLIACDSGKVTETFVLMNDDFFFIKPQSIFMFKRSDLFILTQGKGARYRTVINNTLEELGIVNPEDYELHYPMIINKNKFKQILNEFPWREKELLHRSIYGNILDENHYTIIQRDFKAFTYEDWESMFRMGFVSTSERSFMFRKVSKDLNNRFNSPSIYEVKENE